MGRSVSREIIEQFKSAGVQRIFGIPGSNASIELIREGREQGIPFVPVGHEAAGAIMAGTYGCLTESVGTCLAIMGPGALNVNSGLLHCLFERTPVLAITERYGANVRDRVRLQNINHDSLFRPVVKLTETITPENCGNVVALSLETARSERPGPVHLDLPHDVYLEDITSQEGNAAPEGNNTGANSEEDWAECLKKMSAASRPLIIVGSLALREGVGNAIERFCEKLSIPILVSMKARSVIDEDNIWYAGPFLGVGKIELIENRLLEQADLVIAIGIDGHEIVMPAGKETPAISIDRIETDVISIFKNATCLLGAPDEILTRLSETATPRSIWQPEEVEQVVRGWLGHIASFDTEDSVQAVIRNTRDLMADQDLFICDIGLYSKLVEQLWVAKSPGTFHTSLAARNMGSALPMAIGASLAKPDLNTVCFIGDGGLLIHLPELNVIAQENLPITMVVFVDGGWGTIRVFQRNKDYELEGTNFHQPNWLGIASQFGFETAHARNEVEYRECLGRMLEGRKPSLITVAYQQEEYDKILSMVR
jgi:acetolactate synthase I/II/III large subunit